MLEKGLNSATTTKVESDESSANPYHADVARDMVNSLNDSNVVSDF